MMDTEQEGILEEKYSPSEDYCYEIYKNSDNQFDVFTFKYDQRKDGYHMLHQHRYLADSLAEAIALGDRILQELDSQPN